MKPWCIFIVSSSLADSSLSTAWCSHVPVHDSHALRQCLSGTAWHGRCRSISFTADGMASCLHSLRDPGATGAFDAFMGRHSHPGREEMKADLVERLDGLSYIYIYTEYIYIYNMNVVRYSDVSTVQIRHMHKHLQAKQRLVQNPRP